MCKMLQIPEFVILLLFIISQITLFSQPPSKDIFATGDGEESFSSYSLSRKRKTSWIGTYLILSNTLRAYN